MKIYFAGSICGGRDDQNIYQQLIGYLERYGEVLTKHIGDSTLTNRGETISSSKEVYERDLKWLKEADIIIAEVTTPSLGVGYEIAKAETMNKKIICLYRPSEINRLSALVAGNPNVTVTIYTTIEEAKKIIDKLISKKQ